MGLGFLLYKIKKLTKIIRPLFCNHSIKPNIKASLYLIQRLVECQSKHSYAFSIVHMGHKQHKFCSHFETEQRKVRRVNTRPPGCFNLISAAMGRIYEGKCYMSDQKAGKDRYGGAYLQFQQEEYCEFEAILS